MYFVYLIQSKVDDGQRYIGVTTDVHERLQAHNYGESPHTSKFKPWELIAYVAFRDREPALAFEKYLKSGSGRAFALKRFWPQR